jgi:DNA-directed RNA polymerase subunit M/transcription elongation factor TFIIS
MFCKECGSLMNEVLSFSANKRTRYNTCMKCRNETPKNKLTDKEIDERFGRDDTTYVKKISKY